MALLKKIQQEDGLTTEYHRILYLTQTVNSHNSIAVVSYINADARITDAPNGASRPYRSATTYQTDYNEDMTIGAAYSYLKTLPEFEGAEDV